MKAVSAPKRWLGPGITAGVCAGLLVVFATLSYGAAAGWFWTAGKSATYDEPLHVLGAYVHRHHGDYRINPEDPALFGRIVSLAHPADALRIDTRTPVFQGILDEVGLQWPFIWTTLYRTPRNNEQMMLSRSRAMTVLVGVVLGAAIAWWAYLLAGPLAAFAATALYAFDANFLAHAAVVKNDVPLACVLCGLMLSVWLLGKRATWARFVALTLLCGAAVSIKYSGVLAGPTVALALLIRALMPQAWAFVGFDLQTRLRRLMAVVVTVIACLLVSWLSIWAVYGFRFRPAPGPNASFNMASLERLAKMKEIQSRKERVLMAMEKRGEAVTDPSFVMISQQEMSDHQPARVVRIALWLNDRRLLPQGWLAGFVYTYATTLLRSTFLNGQVQNVGWWYFFPLAMLYKTPLATLAAAGGALVTLLVGKIVLGFGVFRRLDWWATACLLIAPLLYGASALSASLNLGLRHILPVYPYIFIGIAVVVAMTITRWRIAGLVVVGLLAMGLIVETVARYPNFIPFFNILAGGPRRGFGLLGDSNLDWGQDLKLLADWQRANPDKELYLSYFGIADPEYYGIKARHLPGGYVFAQQQWTLPDPSRPSVLAISATQLQGIYLTPELRKSYNELVKQTEFKVLGGSIYLYNFPFPAANSSGASTVSPALE